MNTKLHKNSISNEGNSIFIEHFGDYPKIRVLDFLIESEDLDYSMTEIMKNSNVGWTSFKGIWKNLLKNKVIIPTRKIGNAKLFKLNTENEFVKKLVEIDRKITKEETDKLFSKEKIKISV